jgi:hypothetical protein
VAPPPEKPVEAVPPAVVVEPPPPPKLEGYERSWACSAVSQVSPVIRDAFNTQWHFFSVAFDHERSLVVFTDGSKKKRLAKLTQLRDAVAACGGKQLGAKRVDERHVPFRTDLVTAYGGDMVELDDLEILAQK